MNKFIILVLAAMVASALAAPSKTINSFGDDPSELALFESDEVEASGLQGERVVFSDFCIASRDHVKNFLKNSTNVAASNVFKVMFDSVGDITADLIKAEQSVVERSADLIKESGFEKPVMDSEQSINQSLDRNADKVKSGIMRTLSDAVKTVLQTVIDVISSETSKRLALLKAEFSMDNARVQLETACRTISYNMKADLNNQLRDTKQYLLSAKTDIEPSMKFAIESAQLNDVGCTTTSRISKISRLCDVFLTFGPVLYPMIGL